MLNKEKGITLIALIITIIVMLILVGVTINVALNGGLFEKAETAKTETNKALEKEELMQIVVAEYDVKNDVVNADNVKTQATNYTEDTSKSVEGETLVLQGKSGIFWEINLETAQVKEYEEVTVTSTIWEQRGVTSSNVKFDTLYYVPLMSGDSFDSGMTFGLYSNGDMCIHLNRNTTDTTVSKKDENGNNSTGSNGATTDVVGQAITAEVIKTFSNGLTMPFGERGQDMTVRYTSENTVEVYMATPDERAEEDGTIPVHVPEDEKYKVATLIPQ